MKLNIKLILIKFRKGDSHFKEIRDMKLIGCLRILFCFILICHSSCIWATHTISNLQLHQLIEIALHNNKDLQAAQYNVDRAKTRLIQAGQWPNPSLNVLNSDDQLFTQEGEYERSAGFSQDLPISGRIGRQKNVARVDIELAMTEIANVERKLGADVAASYYRIQIIDRRLEQINFLLPINQRLMKVTRNRLQAAEVSELDANTARLEYERLVQEKITLQAQRKSELAKLNAFLGRSANCSLNIVATLPPCRLPTLSTAQAIAFQCRSDLQAEWLMVNRAQAEVALARTNRWADWRIGANVAQDKLVVEGAPPQKSDNRLNVNLSIPLPLLNTNRGQIEQGMVDGTQAYTRIQALRLNIQNEVTSAYILVQSLQTVVQQSQQDLLPLSRRNVRLAQQAYSQGQISLFEVIQIQRQQNDLQLAYLNALDQYLQAWVRLHAAMGNWTTH